VSSILDSYVLTMPSVQNAIDIFKGEWSSELPLPGYVSGSAKLFDDPRVTWARDALGGFSGRRILELGPLEGAHSCMLERFGAAEVLAIESNTRAYLKCLIVKELFRLQRCVFLLGNFMPYLASTQQRFDVIFASGVLYHMMDPVGLLQLVAAHTDEIFLWTHYYDTDIIRGNPVLTTKFAEQKTVGSKGDTYRLHQYLYKESVNWQGFCGGGAPFSCWMEREGILSLLRSEGFARLDLNFDHRDHPNGPSMAIVARR